MATAFARDPLAFFTECARRPGPAVNCRLGGDGYLLKEPDDIRHVLVRNQAGYVKSRRLAGPRATYPPPRSLLTSAGEEHRRKRIAIQRIFGRALAEKIGERARVNSGDLAEGWNDGEEVELAGTMRALAQRNILELLFGPALRDSLDELATLSAARRRSIERVLFSLFPVPEYLPNRANLGYVRATRRLHAAVGAEIDAVRAGQRNGDSMLAGLTALTFEDGTALTDSEVRDEVLTFALTGYDSVSEALAWTLRLVAEHPDVAGEPAVLVRESLRLFPPTWIFARVALGDDALPSGARIPEGSKVYLCPWVVHRDARLWPEPERFDTARFAVENGRPRYSYFPFGGGSHVCIAETLAMAQVTAVLETITATHRLEPIGPTPRPIGGLTLSPGGDAKVRAHARA